MHMIHPRSNPSIQRYRQTQKNQDQLIIHVYFRIKYYTELGIKINSENSNSNDNVYNARE